MTKPTDRYITISPKDFIHGPYIKCPKCNKDAFGILSIFSHSYTRRCRECLFPKGGELRARYDLPSLNKKIIYLDQNAISEMMKVLNPRTDAHQKKRVQPFWKTLFEEVDSLVKLQLIICPDSDFHRHESLLSQYHEPLKRMYELLSHKISFNDHDTIHRFQLIGQFKRWLGMKTSKLDVHQITHGEINGWQERFIISLDDKGWPDLINELRSNKAIVVKELLPIFQRWQSEKEKDFNFWFCEEVQGHAEIIINSYKRQLSNYAMAFAGVSIQPGLLLPDMTTVLIYQMKEILKGQKMNEAKINSMILDFFKSKFFQETPYVKLASMLWATVAKKASAGQKKPPNKGFMIDVNIISTLLPYCDAMFVDDVCRSYLTEQPLFDEAKKYDTKIFSNKSKEAFLDYLYDIKAATPPEHFKKVEEVYGPDWGNPFVELYTYC